MSLIPWWMKAIVVAALVAFVAWEWHLFLEHEQDIGYQKRDAEQNIALLAAQAKATRQEVTWKNQIKGAEDERDNLRKAKNAMAASNAAVVDKLREQLTNISNGLSDITITACRARVSTLTIVFGQCTDRLADMANHAQGHYVDSVTCRKEWPK